jgi:hypothetical protein
MTPRTRSTNKDANYKVYYSKKVPQQIHFPHRRKIVRRPLPKDASDKKQMRFLPDKMRVRRDVVDSEEEVDEEDMEGGGVVIGSEAEEEVEEETGSGKSTKARGAEKLRIQKRRMKESLSSPYPSADGKPQHRSRLDAQSQPIATPTTKTMPRPTIPDERSIEAARSGANPP